MSVKFEKYGIPEMIGQTVSFASYDEDNRELNIGFADGAGISISNPFTVTDISIDQLMGRTITATGGDSLLGDFVIEFCHGKLIIDVRPESYRGPEAFLFCTDDRRYFVG